MRRMAFAVIGLVACWTTQARADTFPMIDNLPATYTPGTAFTFDLRLPALTNFTDFTIQMLFSTDVVNPPLFASGAAATSGYPFAGIPESNFQSTLNRSTTSTDITLTISDSVPSPGVSVTPGSPGSNDSLARITVTPDALMRGEIRFSIKPPPDSIYHSNPEDPPYDFPTGVVTIIQADVPPPAAVPAPPAVVLIGVGALLLGLRSRFRRAATSC